MRLAYSGPPKLRRSIEFALRSDVDGVRTVEIRDAATDAAAGAAAGASAGAAAGAGESTPTVPAVPRRFSGAHRFVSRVGGEAGGGGGGAGGKSAAEVLHSVGWVKLARDPVPVDGSTLAELRAAPYAPIFNGQSPGEAPLRHMGRHPAWAARFEAHFASALREERAGRVSTPMAAGGGRLTAAWRVSRRGCSLAPTGARRACATATRCARSGWGRTRPAATRRWLGGSRRTRTPRRRREGVLPLFQNLLEDPSGPF